MNGKREVGIEGRSGACSAALSTFSLPGITTYPGAQMKVMGEGNELSIVSRVWM